MSIFAANRESLGGRHGYLRGQLEGVDPRAGMAVEEARSGEPTARLRSNGEPGPYLHSRVAPRTEARRAAGAISAAAGYVAVWGPGLFYVVEALLERQELTYLLVIEPRAAFLRAALESRDLRPALSDPRLHIRTGTDAGPDDAGRAVSETYLPVIHGAFHLEGSRPRAEESRETLSAVGAAARGQLADLAVQQRFGRLWFSNAIRNLTTFEPAAVDFPAAATMIVAAAGPSLESQVADLDSGIPIISTDTAAPALLQRGIRPASVVSLDCQQVSYHHLLTAGGALAHVPLVADLSSPPTVLRHSGPGVLAATAYPLARLLRGRFPALPFIDGAGGNVTQAAISVAVSLGAVRIHLLGADLAYPDGAPYARDSYLYPYFRSHETRLHPTQSALMEMVLADTQTVSADEAGRRVYRPPKLSRYRESLERQISKLEAEVISGPPEVAPGRRSAYRGSEVHHGNATGVHRFEVPSISSRVGWLKEYEEQLSALSIPTGTAMSLLVEAGGEDRELWYSVLPAAAAFMGEELDVRQSPAVLETALRWTAERLSRVLAAHAAKPTPP
ncbi:MAG: DUF115 domain-containing protein [Spirochaetes bacterium]|jgi:hypothetical protein|nr:DUF115 domain-containing protein [Spirochaetota bacterium]